MSAEPAPAADPSEVPAPPERAAILRAAIGLGLYAGVFGASFGAISIASGLSVGQTMVLSLVMFSGASQFAFAGVVATGGAPAAAVAAALLLGVRNAFYGLPISEIVSPRGLARLWTAHFVIDETTAMALGQASPRARRYAFWSTGLILCALWQVGSLTGALVGSAVDPDRARAGRGRAGGLPGPALAEPQAHRGASSSRSAARRWRWPWCPSRRPVYPCWPPPRSR